jgi:FixJ family two-component response regulator
MDGSLNKEIAFELSISLSTVEAHRANIMKKMKAKNLAQLIKMYLQVQFIKEYT